MATLDSKVRGMIAAMLGCKPAGVPEDAALAGAEIRKFLTAHEIEMKVSAAVEAFTAARGKNAKLTGAEWAESLKPVEFTLDVLDEVAPAAPAAPKGPTAEDIAAAKERMNAAKATLNKATPFMKEVAQKLYDMARAEYEALSGKAEEAETEQRDEIEFEVLEAGELPVTKYVSGAVTLTAAAAKMLLDGPAWITDAGKKRAMCDPACETGVGIVFMRVYGADQVQYLPRVIAAGKVLKLSVMPADAEHSKGGKVAAMFLSDYENGNEPPEAHILDVTKTGDWLAVGAMAKLGGGKLGGANVKSGVPSAALKGGRLGGSTAPRK